MNGPLGPSASRHRSLGELKAYQTMQVQSMLGE